MKTRKGVQPHALVKGLLGIQLIFHLLPATSLHADDEIEDEHAHEHEHVEHEDTETIVVTASPLEHNRDEVAVPVERVGRAELIENLGSTLGETLSHIPGITSTGFAGGASRPVIRGQDAYRTEVLEDGLRTQDVSRESPDHAVPINPLAARRVEVVRGPATLRYGGGAAAGVINAITNRVPERLPGDAITGEVFGAIGTVANERDLAARLEGGLGRFAWHADGSLRTTNDYNIPNDDRPHTQSGSQIDAFSGAVGGSWIEDYGRLGFAYMRLENEYGIPEEGENVEIDMQTDRFRFEGDLAEPIEGIREIRMRGVYSDYEHDEIAGGDVGQTYENEEFEGRLEAIHEEVLGFVGAVGIQGGHRDFRGEGEAAEFLAPAETRTMALYVFEERELLEGLTGEFGFRVEYTNVDGKDIADAHYDRDFIPLSGALGLVAEPLDWLTIGLNGAISQRAPSQVELFARGAHEATGTFEIGDPRLDEEIAYAGDLRIEAKGSRGRIEGAAFLTFYEDYVYGALTGNSVDEDGNPLPPADPDALDELAYRARDALFYGAELSGELDAYELDWGRFGVDGRFDFVRARFRNGNDRDLPRITPMRFGGGLFFRSERFDARFGVLHTQPQKQVSEFERKTKGFTHLNASLTGRVGLLADRVPVELTIVARNLADVRGRNHVAFNKDEVLLPGRAFRFGIRARF
ncbi:MAG: TonB-dependent receptor [Deltaproteobacteria bacterium]|jgi:iron complex outermembrane receptor protein|nr:TonB-dependent receptor [Deltaproteobacteria bacterium]MBW2499929.1 TonB-dependent receptor [Deltaproteobacteria bacterium]